MKTIKLNLLEKKEMKKVCGGQMQKPSHVTTLYQCKRDPCMEMEPFPYPGMPLSAQASIANMATGVWER